jgi:hypothetical protein
MTLPTWRESIQCLLHVLFAQPHVGLWRDDDHVLARVVADIDQRATSSHIGVTPHRAAIYPFARQRCGIRVGMWVSAHTPNHRHQRALPRCCDGLITALSPKKLAKISAEQRLAWGWQMRRPRHQIDDQAAHHNDISHFQRSPMNLGRYV